MSFLFGTPLGASYAAPVIACTSVVTGPPAAVLPHVRLHEDPSHSRLCAGYGNRPTTWDIHSAFVRRTLSG